MADVSTSSFFLCGYWLSQLNVALELYVFRRLKNQLIAVTTNKSVGIRQEGGAKLVRRSWVSNKKFVTFDRSAWSFDVCLRAESRSRTMVSLNIPYQWL